MSYMSRINLDLQIAKENGIEVWDYDKVLAYNLEDHTRKYIESIGKKKWNAMGFLKDIEEA